jgi:pimeloyl-ACP methyl ester carboxylesterase
VPDIHRIVDTLSCRIPGVKRVIFGGAGHMLDLEQPDRFNRGVEDVLSRR